MRSREETTIYLTLTSCLMSSYESSVPKLPPCQNFVDMFVRVSEKKNSKCIGDQKEREREIHKEKTILIQSIIKLEHENKKKHQTILKIIFYSFGKLLIYKSPSLIV